MRRNLDKTTTAVLIHIPNDLYELYLTTLRERGLKRQVHSSKLFVQAIEEEIEKHSKESK